METIAVSSGAEETAVSDGEAPTIPVVQVQSVIQPNQPSVIQTAGQTIQTIQLAPGTDVLSEGEDDEDSERRRRELLARRPSYRKILNELADTPSITITKIEEESNSSQTSQDDAEASEAATNLSTNTVVIPTHAIQIAGSDVATQGLQTLTMTNAAIGSTAVTPAGATIVQYAQSADGQFFIPAGNMQAYQIATAAPTTTLPQGVVMATTGSSLATSPQQLTEEAQRKRELRLLKNRDAARDCRRKKKDYIKCLETRVSVLENQNKCLISELKSLKELYCQQDS